MSYQAPTPSPPIPPASEPDAALGRRVGAGLIDILILLVVMIVIGVFFGETRSGGGSYGVFLSGFGTLLFALVLFLYYFVTESQWSRTPGKAALGLSVVSAEGGKPTSGAIAIRTILRFVDWLPFFYLVGFVSVLATGARRERLGDLAAKTRVVRTPNI